MNSVVLSGRLASDPELKYTPNGTAMAKFRVAVRDPFRKDDNGKAGADFFDVVAWRGPAEFTAKYLEKGSAIMLKGRLRQETWKTDSGETRQRIVVNADDVESGGPKSNGGDQQQQQASKPAVKPAPATTEEPDYDPFADDV